MGLVATSLLVLRFFVEFEWLYVVLPSRDSAHLFLCCWHVCIISDVTKDSEVLLILFVSVKDFPTESANVIVRLPWEIPWGANVRDVEICDAGWAFGDPEEPTLEIAGETLWRLGLGGGALLPSDVPGTGDETEEKVTESYFPKMIY